MQSSLWTVYIDGSAVPNPGRMRLGGVITAPDGHTHTFSEPVAHDGCNNEAEALAAIHALHWLQAQQAQAVLLYTDNSILAEQLRLPQPKPIVRLQALYTQLRALLGTFAQVQVQWIPRHKNTVADALARGPLDAPLAAPTATSTPSS